MILDTEAAVIANFEFLSQTDVDMDDDDDMSDDLEPPDDDDQDDVKTTKRKGKVIISDMLYRDWFWIYKCTAINRLMMQ
jgi:striatin 1/3/4